MESNPLKLGYCGLDDTQIWYMDPDTNRMVLTEYYAEFHLMLSNGTIMTSSICTNCINDLDDDKVNILMERIKDSWMQERPDLGRSPLTVITWSQDEAEAEQLYQDKLAQVLDQTDQPAPVSLADTHELWQSDQTQEVLQVQEVLQSPEVIDANA